MARQMVLAAVLVAVALAAAAALVVVVALVVNHYRLRETAGSGPWFRFNTRGVKSAAGVLFSGRGVPARAAGRRREMAAPGQIYRRRSLVAVDR